MGSQPGIIIFFSDFENICEILSKDQKGDLLDALIAYGRSGELYSGSDPLILMAFNVLAAGIKRTEERYINRCQRNAANAKKRWENANACNRMQSHAKQCEEVETKRENKTKSKNKTEKENNKEVKKKNVFIPPTISEVSTYCQERKNNINPDLFVNYYETRGWELKPGQKMKDWKACVRTWEQNQKERAADNHNEGGRNNVGFNAGRI